MNTFECPHCKNVIENAAVKNAQTCPSFESDSIFRTIKKIQEKFSELKINAKIVNTFEGPVVNTYECALGEGERLANLFSIEEDLSLALQGTPIRIVYPDNGKTTVSIEVPRQTRDYLHLDEILTSKNYIQSNQILPIVIGKNTKGEPIFLDLTAMPNILVAGSTGTGKSVFIKSILVSLLTKKVPNQMKLILIDTKQLELVQYAAIPHLLKPVISSPQDSLVALEWVIEEIKKRHLIMSKAGVRNIEGFNHKLKNATRDEFEKIDKFGESEFEKSSELSYIVVVIDEFADLLFSSYGKEIEGKIIEISGKSKAAGIHLIITTQRPSNDVITSAIRASIPTQIAFRMYRMKESKNILDIKGADKLLGKGDMLFKYGPNISRIHTTYIDDNMIEELIENLSRGN